MHSLVSQSWLYLIILYVALAVWGIPEMLGSIFRRSEKGAVKRDRGSHLVLYAGMFIGIFAAFFFSFGVPAATIEWHQPVLFWVGIALLLAGIAFRWYAIRVLGKYFTRDVATRTGQEVVESGPYRYIRHPAYSGTLITALGFGLATTNWLALIAIVLGVSLSYSYRVRVEERALCEDLGDVYRGYMRRTRRFIPFVW
ncbi:MAG: methyltransferase family protein [Gammaproteobacteria bacterium]